MGIYGSRALDHPVRALLLVCVPVAVFTPLGVVAATLAVSWHLLSPGGAAGTLAGAVPGVAGPGLGAVTGGMVLWRIERRHAR